MRSRATASAAGAERTSRRADGGAALAALHRLSTAALRQPLDDKTLTLFADALSEFVGASKVFFTYALDQGFIVHGGSKSGNDIGTSQIGLWLVQRELGLLGQPVAFNIEKGRVRDFAAAAVASGRRYVAFKVPTSESPAEMLIIEGPWQERVPPQLIQFIDAAMPSITVLLERMLNAARGARQKEHLLALANAADMLTRSEDVQPALVELATAVAAVASYDFSTIGVYEPGAQTVSLIAQNRNRFSNLSGEQEWRNLLTSDPGLHAIGTLMRETREPFAARDAQEDERVPETVRDFARRSLLRSSISLPLFFGDECLGFLQCSSFTPRDFPPAEIAFMKGIASQVAAALKAMQMYKALAESEAQLREYAQRLQASMEIQHRLARTDALTGIPNRRYIEEVIDAECARAVRHDTALSIVMLDVDGLKRINDTYGHQAGDDVLVQLAQLARRSCRKGDTVGRLGGDEFLFVLPGSGLAAGARFAERFRARVERHEFPLSKGETVAMKASLGVAEFTRGTVDSAGRFVELADEALYEAKKMGGNRVCARPATSRAA